MSMSHSIEGLRATGDPKDTVRADIIETILKGRGEDIPLSSVSTPAETQTVAKTPEAPVEIKRFSVEQKKALEKQDFLICSLTGQSIKTLRDSGRTFWTTWHEDLPDFESLASIRSEVAINPKELFLPKSNNKTLTQQEKMVEKFSQELGEKIKGVEAIIGQASDYAEFAFRHLDATGDYLFGRKYAYNCARTKTPTFGSDVANVGCFSADGGLFVDSWRGGYGIANVLAAPLVVPTGK